MSEKSTHRERDQRIKAYEKRVPEHGRVANELNSGERVYREVFDAVLDGMLIIDVEGTIIDVNDAFCKIAGHSYDELIETNVRDLIYPSHWGDLDEFMSKIERRGKAQLKGAKIHKDDSAFTVEVHGVKFSYYDMPSFVLTVRCNIDHVPTEESLRESERKYWTLLEKAPLGISIMRDDRSFEYFNPKFTEIFGYTIEDIPDKKTWFNKAYPDEVYRKETAFTWKNDLVNSEEIREVEPRTFTVRCKDGLDKIVRFRVVALEHGEQLLIYEDITTNSMAKAALRQSEKRLRDLANLLPQTIFETDRKGNITFVNLNGLKSFGYSQEDIDNGLDAIQLYLPEDRREVRRISQAKLRGENIEQTELTALRKDGSTFPVLIYSDVIMDLGKPAGLRGIVLDMTARKRAEKALKDSEEKYRVVVENANEGIVVVQDGILRFVNNFIIDLLGSSNDKLTSQPFIEFVHPDDRELVMGHYDESLKGEKIPKKYNLRVVDKNGNIKWIQNSGVIIEWSGRPATLNFLIDITYQKQALNALQESEETLKAILAASPVGIGLVRNRIVFWINKAMYDMIGYEEGSFLGESARIFYPNDEEYKRVGRELYPEIEKRGIGKVEARLIKKDGNIIDCYIQASILDFSDSDKGIIIAVMDISDRKRTEELVHKLTQRLLQAQENERQRISRDLHDHVAQDLSTLNIICKSLFNNQPEVPSEIKQKVLGFSKIIEKSIIHVRDLAYNLRPVTLDEIGLVQTIYQFCEDFSEGNHIHLDFHSAGMNNLKLDYDTEINLYRLVQEALNNIKRHADASMVTVRLVASFPNIILRIKDNGKGFNVNERLVTALHEKRMGIRSMEERVSLLGGKMTIQSGPMNGTNVIIKIPYKVKTDG